MSGFSMSWLDLREPADLNARAKSLASQALLWLETRGNGFDNIVTDLGSGTGSSLRALTRLGARNIVWRLVDHDGKLLDEALKRHNKQMLIEAYQSDLTVIEELPFCGVHLVTASALFDLASREFVDALVERLVRQKAALYVALNYDGNTEWTPAHPLDKTVLAAFNQDQRRDKGFGLALGPDATDYLQRTLEAEGYRILVDESPWLLGAQDHELIHELIKGIANTVKNNYGLDRDALHEWQAFRFAHAEIGTCKVGHLDLLALPY